MHKNDIPQSIIDCINNNNKFVIMAHKQPDADTLSSAIALDSYLSRNGKETSLYTAGPFTRTETMHLQDRFNIKPLSSKDKTNSVVIIVDCNSPDRVGFLEDDLAGLPVMIIDHHDTESNYGDHRWVNSTYPATALMIQDLILGLDDAPNTFEAETLFLGFCTDTGFFKHLDIGSDKWIKKAATLVGYGASPKNTFRVMNGGKTLTSRKLLGRILERSEEFYDGKVIISWETLEDRKELNAMDRDSDALYQSLLSIQGVEAIAVLREESIDKCAVGLRSIQDVNVSKLAESFGGGGHQRASGFVANGKLFDIKKELITRFKDYL